MINFRIVLFLLTLFVRTSCDTRGALVVTLAGTRKLSDYFEWTCRTIGESQLLFCTQVNSHHNAFFAS
jgi:hypothetical protein